MLHNAWPETLAFLLRRNDIAQTELARRMAINRHTVSRWVTGKSHPRDEQFEEIAGAFACSPSRLGQIYARLLADHYAGAGGPDGTAPAGAADGPALRPSIPARAEALARADLDHLPLPLRALLRAHHKNLRDLVARLLADADELVCGCEDLAEELGRRRKPCH